MMFTELVTKFFSFGQATSRMRNSTVKRALQTVSMISNISFSCMLTSSIWGGNSEELFAGWTDLRQVYKECDPTNRHLVYSVAICHCGNVRNIMENMETTAQAMEMRPSI